MQLRGLSGAKEKLQRVGFKLDRQRDFCMGKRCMDKGKDYVRDWALTGRLEWAQTSEAERGNSFY